MKIIIHRGSSEIGGTCIELVTKKTKLLLDVGAPLNPNSRGIDISSIKPDAVIISHPHQDHYGLIESIGSGVPVYIGELGRKFIDATGIFLKRKLLNNNFKYYKSWKKFQIGDFTITPFLVDHSSIDAHAFLIESEGKRLFYSGDFRAHGRKSKLFEIITKNPPENIDILFMEGTLLGRNDDELPNEEMIESEILWILKEEPAHCFFICSSQNIDRLVSAYRASKKAGRIFVVDIYTAWILKELSMYSDHTPNINWRDIRVLPKGRTASRHYKIVKENPEYFKDFRKELYKKDNVITDKEIAEGPQKYFIKTNYIDVKYFTYQFRCCKANVIYSMWKGYLKKEYNPKGYRELQKLQNDPDINFIYIHSSGHAFIKDLKKFASAINPKKLIPIHTEHPDDFKEYFKNIFLLEDGKELTL